MFGAVALGCIDEVDPGFKRFEKDGRRVLGGLPLFFPDLAGPTGRHSPYADVETGSTQFHTVHTVLRKC